MTSSTLVKIYFLLDQSDWHGHSSESLWAKPLTQPHRVVYELQNSPFFTIGVSYLDIVECRTAEDGSLIFADVAIRGGHSTFVVLVPPSSGQFDLWWAKLAQLGCTYETGRITLSIGERIMYSVDVSDAGNVVDVRRLLLEGAHADIWLFQDGYIAQSE